ncbi:MAG: ATPase, T2SS/T4P/T4SS family [Candidatus Anammoxibacter sp.]
MSKFANLFKANEEGNDSNQVNLSNETGFTKGKFDLDNIRFTLLFVDDEKNVLNSLKRVFLDENYEILTAISGEEAIEIVKNNRVHLMVTDFKMPNMLGTELLKEIKDKWPEIIRVMLTGYADIQAIMGAVNEGAVYKFITKPWNDEDLRLTISLALQQYVLIQENKELKERTKKQEQEIKHFCSLSNEYSGMLGDVLVETSAITKVQLSTALKEKRSGEFISEVVARLGFASESDIVRVIQKHQNLEYVDVKEVEIDRSLAKLFTQDYCINNRLIPIKLGDMHLTLAMADPTDITKIDNISILTGFNVIAMVATSSDIMSQIESIYGEKGESGKAEEDIDMSIDFDPMEEIDIIIEDEEEEINIEELTSMSGVPPVKRIVNAIILEALRYKASDIHIEPKTKYTIVRFRVDGMLETKIKIPSNLHAATVSRIKVIAKMDIAERRKPQDGRINIRVGTRIVDLRISVIPTISGEKAVIRILDKGSSVRKLSELGMLDIESRKLNLIIKKPQGIIIATGPTGSGKTTLLYSILTEMLESSKNFETIEDPVEYFVEDANQICVRPKIGLSFASVLRATLRQDPDVILIGEIRDAETADAAFKASLTGHMVLTTLHTNNSVASITRLIDIGVKPYLIASAIESIVAQRLVRKVCKYCKTNVPADKKILDMLKIPEDSVIETVVGKGCSRCGNDGYSGRIGVFEVFLMNDEMRHFISTGFKESEIIKLAKAAGMNTLMDNGIKQVKAGVTTLEELVRVIGPPTLLEYKCKQCASLYDITFMFCPYCSFIRSDICGSCKMPLDEEWKGCPSCGTKRSDISGNDQ